MNDKINISQEIIGKYKHLGLNQDNLKVLIDQYNKYIASIVDKRDYNYKNIHNCSKHRVKMVDKGKRPPCHACKYVKRSMHILMDYMFVDKRDVSLDRLVFLLQNAFYNKLRLTRVNHMRLLASNLASMGNIMFSCADDSIYSFACINYITSIIKYQDEDIKDSYNNNVKSETDDTVRWQITKLFISNNDIAQLSKIDKALLYYLVAFRFYIIAKLDKDASDCLLKILIIINNALTVDASSIFNNHKLDYHKKTNNLEILSQIYPTLKNLFETLFMRYAKLVNRQGTYSGHSEVQDIRKILHMHDEEYINLTRSHLYSELIETIWHIIDSEIKILVGLKNLGCREITIDKKDENIDDVIRCTILNAYNHFKYVGMPHNTSYSEVIFYYAKFNLNNYILNDILHITEYHQTDNIDRPRADNNKHNNLRLEVCFLQNYRRYIVSSCHYNEYVDILNIDLNNQKSKQDFVEFVIEDSIICLSEILYILTPFNHISSFSNNFVAGIYNSLWEYAKMYETLGLMYDYKKHKNTQIYDKLFDFWFRHKSARDAELKNEIESCCPYISDNVNLTDKYGSLRNRMLMRLKHNIDDRTFKYTISYYAAEMALRYYSLIESSYYEGSCYRNQISRNYLLNDDLDNDTWLFNTAIERFRINTNDIKNRKEILAKAITDSHFYRYESYVMEKNQETEQFDIFDEVRFNDSLFTNTEL